LMPTSALMGSNGTIAVRARTISNGSSSWTKSASGWPELRRTYPVAP
jgi:hypothetical protein